MKDIVVNIIGTQEINGEENIIEMTAEGQMKTVNGKTYIIYDDSASAGVDGVTSTVKVDIGEQAVTMQRSGKLGTRMYIKKGQRQICQYETSEGIINLGIFGESLVSQLTDDGGKISFSYTIDVNNGLMSRNRIDMTVKPAD